MEGASFLIFALISRVRTKSNIMNRYYTMQKLTKLGVKLLGRSKRDNVKDEKRGKQ